ncbi:MAG: transporter [Dysgonamonadaceae bacterium]|jgi:Tol biopolymer transport system component|nr:transporter [Dysgonamonadaceae bacterium]
MAYFNYLKFWGILVCSFCVCLGNAQENKTVSKLEIYHTETGERTVIKEFPYRVEAPNWTPDGQFLIYNSGGKLYKINIRNPQSDEMIFTGFAASCNNDHVLAASGDKIAISHGTKEDGKSRIYILPFAGGVPTLITPMAPSYLHGWSPDGKTLAYCAERNGNFDIYTIPAEGGTEIRLTFSEGLDDGPEFSPCGKFIWFNSVRSGLMQIWRMNVDGSEQTQITFDTERNAWFPHISPDGEKVIYIAYKKGDVNPSDHPPGKNVEICLTSISRNRTETIIELFGGQGTINVNSWSPDSKQFAFVSYQ